jgi:hypothetical protein
VVDRCRSKDKKEDRRINGWHGGCNERHNIQINIGEGEGREKNIALDAPIQCSLVLLEKGRWKQGNELGSKEGSVLGADCRKCAAKEIS